MNQGYYYPIIMLLLEESTCFHAINAVEVREAHTSLLWMKYLTIALYSKNIERRNDN